jgi:hypothetical protein
LFNAQLELHKNQHMQPTPAFHTHLAHKGGQLADFDPPVARRWQALIAQLLHSFRRYPLQVCDRIAREDKVRC